MIMKRLIIICTLAVAIGVMILIINNMPRSDEKPKMISQATSLKLMSPAFKDGGTIPSVYTCDGDDTNPPLSISGVPVEAKSLALIVDDPDAPIGVWDHWVVFDISSTTKEIAAGTEPEGVLGKGSGGDLGYAGPCPPPGVPHHYTFTLYALDLAKLPLTEGASKADVLLAIEGHIVGRADLTGLYGRQK